ncbi:MAG TPA: hypothetical protein VFR11_10285, partial [Micromonosporaceae bacterium]|nr:hypothetical protein [Micromonosporaceae bacterium]
ISRLQPHPFTPVSRRAAIIRSTVAVIVGAGVAVPCIIRFGAAVTGIGAAVVLVAILGVWTIQMLPQTRPGGDQIEYHIRDLEQVAVNTHRRLADLAEIHNRHYARLVSAEGQLARMENMSAAVMAAQERMSNVLADVPNMIADFGIDQRQDGYMSALDGALGKVAEVAKQSATDIRKAVSTPNVVPIGRAHDLRRVLNTDRPPAGR